MKTIDFENHFITQAWVDALAGQSPGTRAWSPTTTP